MRFESSFSLARFGWTLGLAVATASGVLAQEGVSASPSDVSPPGVMQSSPGSVLADSYPAGGSGDVSLSPAPATLSHDSVGTGSTCSDGQCDTSGDCSTGNCGRARQFAMVPFRGAASPGDCNYRNYGPHDLFRQYYVPNNCGGAPAEMYPAPGPVPAHVGHVYYTYQPLYPHEWLYKHHRTYHRYYDGGRGLTRTSVRWW